jgi:hypothetical protein
MCDKEKTAEGTTVRFESHPDYDPSWSSHSLQANSGIVPIIRPRPLPFTSFPINHLVIRLPSDAINFEMKIYVTGDQVTGRAKNRTSNLIPRQ